MALAERGILPRIGQGDGDQQPVDAGIKTRLDTFVGAVLGPGIEEVIDPNAEPNTSSDTLPDIIHLPQVERSVSLAFTSNGEPRKRLATIISFPLGTTHLCPYEKVRTKLDTTAAHAAELDQREHRKT